MKLVDLNKTIDATLKIIWNELKYKAEVVKDYEKLPKVRCFPQKISQVFMNILINAVPAMQRRAMTEEQINDLLIENPKRFFTFR